MGDGQTLALRLQASQFYSTYSFSFSEPWLGGSQPVQFSTSLQHTLNIDMITLLDWLTKVNLFKLVDHLGLSKKT